MYLNLFLFLILLEIELIKNFFLILKLSEFFKTVYRYCEQSKEFAYKIIDYQ